MLRKTLNFAFEVSNRESKTFRYKDHFLYPSIQYCSLNFCTILVIVSNLERRNDIIWYVNKPQCNYFIKKRIISKVLPWEFVAFFLEQLPFTSDIDIFQMWLLCFIERCCNIEEIVHTLNASKRKVKIHKNCSVKKKSKF